MISLICARALIRRQRQAASYTRGRGRTRTHSLVVDIVSANGSRVRRGEETRRRGQDLRLRGYSASARFLARPACRGPQPVKC
jgi:hypothetical protein